MGLIRPLRISEPGALGSAVALLLDRRARARALEALRSLYTTVFVDDADQLIARVSSGPLSLVILESRDRDGRSTLPAIHKIRSGFPSVPVIAYACPGHTRSSEVMAMAHAGAHELIIQGFDDAGISLRAAAESATRQCAGTRVMAALVLELPREVRPFVAFCLERACPRPTVAAAAAYLGVDRRTVTRRLRRHLGITPGVAISWCRLFVAGHLLEDPHRPVSQVALALDFGSSAALRGMLRRYTGLRPNQVREQGGLMAVIAAYRGRAGVRWSDRT
jgi:AraC-like DNA-binding protein